MSRTKKELESTLDVVATQVGDLLNPALTREAIVQGLQELDENLSGDEEDAVEDDEEDDDELAA